MFLGIANGKRLLAVGVPTDSDATNNGIDGAGSINITTDTRTMTFTVTALTADIGMPGTSGGLKLGGEDEPKGTFTIDGTAIPYFELSQKTADIGGEFTIHGFPTTVGLVDVVDEAPLDPIATPLYSGGIFIPGLLVTSGSQAASRSADTLKIDFTLTTSSVTGLDWGFSRLWFDVSVQAFAEPGTVNTAHKGGIWSVSNGLEGVYDRGAEANSGGRDILLYVGDTDIIDGGAGVTKPVVDKLDLKPYIPLPKAGDKPVTLFATDQYMASVTWEPNHDPFAGEVEYTATVALLAKGNYTFIDPALGLVTFTHADADSIKTEDIGNEWVAVTIVFPPDGSLAPVSDLNLTSYIPAPVVDANPTVFFSPVSDTYTVKSIIWSPLNNPFVGGVDYTATVTLTAKPGYTFSGAAPFTHDGAAVTTDNGNETVTLTIKFQKTKTTAIVYITGPFADSNAAGSNTSAVDAMKAHAGYDSLRITMATAGTATLTVNGSYDMGTGLVLNPVNYPANLIINGGNRVLGTSGVVNNPLITVGAGVTLTLTNITFQNVAPNGMIKVEAGGTFILGAGATIMNNKNNNSGGGVYVEGGGTFILRGGTISGNTTTTGGGGVYVEDGGTFIMEDGTISGNTATAGNGGGVYLEGNATFTKTGGTIYGTGDAGANNAANGKVVFVEGGAKVRDTTAGPADNMDSTKDSAEGGWE